MNKTPLLATLFGAAVALACVGIVEHASPHQSPSVRILQWSRPDANGVACYVLRTANETPSLLSCVKVTGTETLPSYVVPPAPAPKGVGMGTIH